MSGLLGFVDVALMSLRMSLRATFSGSLGPVAHVALAISGGLFMICSPKGCIWISRPDHRPAVGCWQDTDPNQALGLGGFAIALELLSPAFLPQFLRLA